MERMPSGGDTVVVRGLVIDNVSRDVSFYVGCAYSKKRMIVDDHGNLGAKDTMTLTSSSEYASSSRLTMWLTLFDQCRGRASKVGPLCHSIPGMQFSQNNGSSIYRPFRGHNLTLYLF